MCGSSRKGMCSYFSLFSLLRRLIHNTCFNLRVHHTQLDLVINPFMVSSCSLYYFHMISSNSSGSASESEIWHLKSNTLHVFYDTLTLSDNSLLHRRLGEFSTNTFSSISLDFVIIGPLYIPTVLLVN